MLFRETVAVYCENHMEHINTLFRQNAEMFNIKARGIHVVVAVLEVVNYSLFPLIYMPHG
jgi:hypothetical protein